MSSRKPGKDTKTPAGTRAPRHEAGPRDHDSVALTLCLQKPPEKHGSISTGHAVAERPPHHGSSSIGERFRDYKRQLEERGGTLEPTPRVYTCALCHDVGYVHPLDESGRVDYSRVVPCEGNNCAAARYRKYQRGEEAARARGVRSPQQTFETFEQRDGSRQALSYARQLGDGSATFIWLLIFGGTGNGKTHLCNAMARESIRRGVDTRLVSVADLFAALRSAMDTSKGESVMAWYKQTQFLILDDYGVQYGSDWEAARFDELMTFRFANYLPTAMTTNLDLVTLPERIRSRFEDRRLSRIAHNSAPDCRSTLRPAV
ncbi:MAG: ATP-binding protein [Dehalococcoidia bacterium]|nr:ATP-binding protein [Dehalococcoidia bacterium]